MHPNRSINTSNEKGRISGLCHDGGRLWMCAYSPWSWPRRSYNWPSLQFAHSIPCQCGAKEVIGSVEELRKKSSRKLQFLQIKSILGEGRRRGRICSWNLQDDLLLSILMAWFIKGGKRGLHKLGRGC